MCLLQKLGSFCLLSRAQTVQYFHPTFQPYLLYGLRGPSNICFDCNAMSLLHWRMSTSSSDQLFFFFCFCFLFLTYVLFLDFRSTSFRSHCCLLASNLFLFLLFQNAISSSKCNGTIRTYLCPTCAQNVQHASKPSNIHQTSFSCWMKV